jgi:DNA-binding PadR family transcriptional regulator
MDDRPGRAEEGEARFDRFFHGPPLRGVVPLAVLRVLKRGTAHGGEIFQTLQEQYSVSVSRPVVYMLLRRLDRYGLVISTWEIPENGPALRKYTITDEGLAHLENGIERLKALSRTIALLTSETGR